MSNDICIII